MALAAALGGLFILWNKFLRVVPAFPPLIILSPNRDIVPISSWNGISIAAACGPQFSSVFAKPSTLAPELLAAVPSILATSAEVIPCLANIFIVPATISPALPRSRLPAVANVNTSGNCCIISVAFLPFCAISSAAPATWSIEYTVPAVICLIALSSFVIWSPVALDLIFILSSVWS